MINKIKIADLPEFDMAEHIEIEADIAAYLNIVLEEGDASELAHVLGIIARAKGMADSAQKKRHHTRGAIQSIASQRTSTL